jgi:hypothetical protein
MALLPTRSGAVTLLDFAKSIDPDGTTSDVVELLNQSNEMLLDMPWIESNLPTGHQTGVRTGLPVSVWRQMYKGVPASKSLRAQVIDAAGTLEARAEVDTAVAERNGNTAEFRLSEAQAFLESMNQNMAQTLFYGDTNVTPERFMGLSPRYSLKSAPNGTNILDAGGTGSNNTSLWVIGWGKNTVTGFFPKGSKAGLLHQDLGEIDAFDDSVPPARYRALADRWVWTCGLSVRDWRYVVRIANIDINDLINQTGTQAPTASTAIIKLINKAFARFPSVGMCTPIIYANRTVKEMLSIAAMDKSQYVLSVQDAINQFGPVSPGSVSGGAVLKFLGTPIRTADQLLVTEARVV